MGDTYFFDTYAFFEIIRGNPKYEKYRDALAITTIFNLAELNYGLKKEMGQKEADEITEKYVSLIVEVNINDVKEAMNLKINQKKLSIPDSIGYIIAKNKKVKFLTGDEDFKRISWYEKSWIQCFNSCRKYSSNWRAVFSQERFRVTFILFSLID